MQHADLGKKPYRHTLLCIAVLAEQVQVHTWRSGVPDDELPVITNTAKY